MQFQKLQLDLTGPQYVFYEPSPRGLRYPLQWNDRALASGMQFAAPSMQSIEFVQGQKGGSNAFALPLPLIK